MNLGQSIRSTSAALMLGLGAFAFAQAPLHPSPVTCPAGKTLAPSGNSCVRALQCPMGTTLSPAGNSCIPSQKVDAQGLAVPLKGR